MQRRMNKYEVVLQDVHTHRYMVEAEGQEDAKGKASDLFAGDVVEITDEGVEESAG